jgi:hypothetical protein
MIAAMVHELPRSRANRSRLVQTRWIWPVVGMLIMVIVGAWFLLHR